MAAVALDRGLWWAGVLVAAGLLTELALSWSVHPLAFVGFILVTCPLVLAGVLTFLWTLTTTQ